MARILDRDRKNKFAKNQRGKKLFPYGGVVSSERVRQAAEDREQARKVFRDISDLPKEVVVNKYLAFQRKFINIQ